VVLNRSRNIRKSPLWVVEDIDNLRDAEDPRRINEATITPRGEDTITPSEGGTITPSEGGTITPSEGGSEEENECIAFRVHKNMSRAHMSRAHMLSICQGRICQGRIC